MKRKIKSIKKLSRAQRHEIYIESLKMYRKNIKKGIHYGLCGTLAGAFDKLYVNGFNLIADPIFNNMTPYFPEIGKHKPIDVQKYIKRVFWFPLYSEEGIQKRIDIFEEAIEETMVTVVIFRKDNNKAFSDRIYALFPFEPYDNKKTLCTSYQHVGQHSAADYELCIRISTPATPDEYADLKKELEGLGYNLDVKTKKPRFKTN